jgi:hypothetical protein
LLSLPWSGSYRTTFDGPGPLAQLLVRELGPDEAWRDHGPSEPSDSTHPAGTRKTADWLRKLDFPWQMSDATWHELEPALWHVLDDAAAPVDSQMRVAYALGRASRGPGQRRCVPLLQGARGVECAMAVAHGLVDQGGLADPGARQDLVRALAATGAPWLLWVAARGAQLEPNFASAIAQRLQVDERGEALAAVKCLDIWQARSVLLGLCWTDVQPGAVVFCVAACCSVGGGMVDCVPEAVVQELLGRDDPQARAVGAQAYGRQRGPEATPSLCQALAHAQLPDQRAGLVLGLVEASAPLSVWEQLAAELGERGALEQQAWLHAVARLRLRSPAIDRAVAERIRSGDRLTAALARAVQASWRP